MRRQKKNKLIWDLARRRDEVIKRTRLLVQGRLPDKLTLHGRMQDFLMWMIEPHVFAEYEIYEEEKDDFIRKKLDKAYKQFVGEDNVEENPEGEG